jgi:hypothetical protein
MNAGGVPNTCKSNGRLAIIFSGERVSNALVTCPEERDNSSKGLLIPHEISEVRGLEMKGSNPLWEGPASHQLVGKVTAYQGNDG